MAKRKRSHRHRNLKHLPYTIAEDKKATEWCALDACQEPSVKGKGSIKNRVRKEINNQMNETT